MFLGKLLKRNYIFFLFCALCLGSCSKKPSSYTLEPIKTCNFPDNPSEVAPLWVCNPEIEGYAVTGIGSAPISKAGIHFTTHKAVANARVVIVQELKTKISNEIKNYIESKNLGESEVVINVSSYIASQITEGTLVGSKTLRTITSKNGILYALVVLTEENYKSSLKEIFNSTINTPNLPKKDFLTNEQLTHMSKTLLNN